MSITVSEAVREQRAVRAENARLIADSAAFLSGADRLARVRRRRGASESIDAGNWREAAELGWLGLRVAEEQGGIGFGTIELCALAEQLGRGLVAEPLIEAICIAPLLPDAARSAQIAGEAIVLPAVNERRGRFSEAPTTVSENGRVAGRKCYVPAAASATAYLVTTITGPALVPADGAGVAIAARQLQDGGTYGEIMFESASAEMLEGSFDAAGEEITLAIGAYLLGVMERAFEITRDYLGTRVQFDRPIGSFQSLQHRMVDLYIQIQLCRASIRTAAEILEDGELHAARMAVSRAKARASEGAMLVTRQGVQMHGGIGFTDECDIGLYLRKAMVLAGYCGTAAVHRARYASLAAKGA